VDVEEESASRPLVDIRLKQSAGGTKVALTCSDRTAVMSIGQLLPALRSLTNSVVEAAVQREEKAGRKTSCKAGCGACCRQLVPISVTEARELPSLIASLDQAHRDRVTARFKDAISSLQASGLWDRLRDLAALPRQERIALAMEYFSKAIPCPFLEDESCSIHESRPLICRQYLVTSPASHCRNPSAETISRVSLAADVFQALKHIEAPERDRPRFVPLVLAPFLTLGDDGSTHAVADWMQRLLAEIKRINDEKISEMRSSEATRRRDAPMLEQSVGSEPLPPPTFTPAASSFAETPCNVGPSEGS
jgi:Fe-S-cluster containining protein